MLFRSRGRRASSERGSYHLEAVAGRVRQNGVTIETCVVDLVSGEESEAIRRVTREHRADFIVMSTHGRAGLGRRFRGSILERILLSAEVPALLVPALQRHPWPQDRALRILARLDSPKPASETLEPAARLA